MRADLHPTGAVFPSRNMFLLLLLLWVGFLEFIVSSLRVNSGMSCVSGRGGSANAADPRGAVY